MEEDIIERKVNRVWLTCPWEVNLLMGENARIERTNKLADHLSEKGYDVTLWFTTFDHPTKKYIANETKVVDYKPNLHIALLHCPVPYKRNTSPIRFYHLSYLAKEMKKCIKDEEKFPEPDVILASYPTEQNCRVLEDYADAHNIPIVLDVRDEWPDIFKRAFPKKLQNAAGFVLIPMKVKATRVFKRADAFCGAKQDLFDWALNYAERSAKDSDVIIPLSAKKEILSDAEYQIEKEKWDSKGISEKTWNICLFSSLSEKTLDIDTLIDAVERIGEKNGRIRLIIGGKGDAEERIRSRCADSQFVCMGGFLNKNEMTYLMNISKLGAVPYKNLKDFDGGAGNKVAQYFSHSLPIITSLQKWGHDYLVQNKCGSVYGENDVQGLCEILDYFISNNDALMTLSLGAETQFESVFDEKINLSKFEKLLNSVGKDSE